MLDMGSGMQSTGGSDSGSGRLSETGSGRDGRDSVDTSGRESALTMASDETGVGVFSVEGVADSGNSGTLSPFVSSGTTGSITT